MATGEGSMRADVSRRPKVHEKVAARLEELFLAGDFAVGSQLPSERALMERFGVGRPAIREALLSLEKMGLVAINNGERARVTRPTPEALVQQLSGAARSLLARPAGQETFQQARLFFETGLARHAAVHAGADDLQGLRAALADNAAALGDREAFERTDVAFHFVLAEIPRNPIFTALHHAIAEWLIDQRRVTLRVAGADRRAYRWHREIFDAIAAGEPDRAESAMRRHLEEVGETYATQTGKGG